MQKENMETKKLMETAFECGLFSQEDVSNPYRGLLQVEQALNVSKKLIVQGSDAGGTAGFSGMVINVAVELAVRSIVSVSYTHLRAHETDSYLVCRLLLE